MIFERVFSSKAWGLKNLKASSGCSAKKAARGAASAGAATRSVNCPEHSSRIPGIFWRALLCVSANTKALHHSMMFQRNPNLSRRMCASL